MSNPLSINDKLSMNKIRNFEFLSIQKYVFDKYLFIKEFYEFFIYSKNLRFILKKKS